MTVAVLENYQQADGIEVLEVLRPYMNASQ